MNKAVIVKFLFPINTNFFNILRLCIKRKISFRNLIPKTMTAFVDNLKSSFFETKF